MVRCSVLGCKSDSERKIPDLSFHSFPDNDKICQKWIEATGRTNWTAKKSLRICSRHFEPNVLIKKKKLTVLFPNAVPLLEIKTCFPTTSFLVSSHIDENMEIDDDSKAQIDFLKEQTPFKLMEDSLLHHNVTETKTSKEQSPIKLMEDSLLHHNVTDIEPKSAKSPNYTPRTMRRRFKRTQQQSAERLKKLKALREKSRRLTKKVANLENVIAELKAIEYI